MFCYFLLLLQKLFFSLIMERVTTDFPCINTELDWIPLEKDWHFPSISTFQCLHSLLFKSFGRGTSRLLCVNVEDYFFIV